ncbi:MurR/RpiR family transcriptional regulator [Microbacterium trichothecenolyticum]|jgi:RpiR family carbohydrate utilization transcriptional regulator|uniref:MurR/RpiR family transcriptional regulator n=1 Tax=Microbacterium trichothecenolyticum TaxID=69370 RepID=UPI0013581111|nr:MurR/RpiR family transcriptional regulator [Microbacterium trichothecenolyticum]MBW9121756.1 MurR/RpiR family transcriptional regulator [Microbacterium trichothecenolyticum]
MTDGSAEANLLHQISRRAGSMSPALRGVADVILADPEAAQSLSITELASRAGVADSTVSRFLRDLNLDGYNQLRLGIAQAIYSRPVSAAAPSGWVYEGILKDDDQSTVVEKVLHGSIEALSRTAERIDPETLGEVVERIHRASSLYFTAMGSSATVAESAVLRFTRAGKSCMFFRDQSAQSIAAATLGSDDIIFAISDSGDSTPVLATVEIARFHGAHVVALTSTLDSQLAERADTVLLTSGAVASSDVYGESVTAKWGQLLVIDVLYANYATRYFDEAEGYLLESYQSSIRPTRSGAQ